MNSNKKTKLNLNKEHKEKFTQDYKFLLKKNDFLIISTTADYHSFCTKKAITKKIKNILIENLPLLKDCKELIRLQKKYKNNICVNHNEYFKQQTLLLKKFIKSKNIFGKIISIIYGKHRICYEHNSCFDFIEILTEEKISKVLNFLINKIY